MVSKLSYYLFMTILQQPSGKPALNPGTSADKLGKPSGLFPFHILGLEQVFFELTSSLDD